MASIQAVPLSPNDNDIVSLGYTDYCLPNKSISSYRKEIIFNNKCLCTENGRYEFCVWENELILWDDKLRTRIWSAGNPTEKEVYLTLTYGGTLTLRNHRTDKLVWASDDDYVDPFLSILSYTDYNNGAYLSLLEEGVVDIVKKEEILWSIPDMGRSTVERILCFGNKLDFNSKLKKGEYICSNENLEEGGLTDDGFAFGLNSKGQVVLYYAANEQFFTIFEQESDEATLVMKGDGNLILYNESDEVVFATSTDDSFGAYLTVEDDGVAKIKSLEGCTLWSKRPDGCKESPLKSNDYLENGEFLCYGNYRFGMDNTGDLSWWNWGTGEKLKSVSLSKTGSRVDMLKNGNMVVRTKKNKDIWKSETHGNHGSVLFMTGTDISDVRIRSLNGQTIWEL